MQAYRHQVTFKDYLHAGAEQVQKMPITLESGENSAEYRVLLTCGPTLNVAVRGDLITLRGGLLAVGLITPENNAEIGNRMFTEAQRADRLMELVRLSVQNNPQNYHKFIRILGQNSACYGHILKQLQEVYKSYQGEYYTL